MFLCGRFINVIFWELVFDVKSILLVVSFFLLQGREAVWQRRYLCLVGPFLYALESPDSRSYKQYIRLSC